ncbi:AsmA-like C-terminal region-containing protein [Tepidamorphus sp. 3E244]|uniref:AsmA family protein n=1 Tax=Tepidamorphus sp. 3E244 TaxID=3385498 RepID=UPI0038FD1073
MNSALLSIGIAIAAALIAALVAPFFIDWGSYRSFFEDRASAILGQPVSIEGDLSARLLPRPKVEASNVTVGSGGRFKADGLVLRLDLTPLMSGNIKVEHVRLEGAELRIAAGEDGTFTGFAAPRPQKDDDDFTLESIEVADSRITVEGPGGEQVLDQVDFTASATNLDGPYKGDGSFQYQGEQVDFTLATGRWSSDGQLRTKLGLTPRGYPVAFDADGMSSIEDGIAQFAGRIRMERIADDNAPGRRWVFRADTEATPTQVRFSALTLGFGADDKQFTMEGAGSLSLGERPRFDAVLGARQADLDRALGGQGEGETTATANLTDVLSRIGALSQNPPPIPGRIGVDLTRVVLSGNLIDDVSLEVAWTGEQWQVSQASASFPGSTTIGLAGDLVPGTDGEDALIFDGAVRIAAERGQAFADWLGEDLRPYTGWLAGSIDGRSDIMVSQGKLSLDNMSLTLDGKPMRGSVAVALADAQEPGYADISLDGERLRFEALKALWSGIQADAGEDSKRISDVSLKLKSDLITAPSFEARGVEIDAHVVDGELDLKTLQIADLGGARLSAKGALSLAGGTQDGVLDFNFDAQALDGAATMLGLLELDRLSELVAARAEALSPLKLTGQMRNGDAADGRMAVSLTGTAAGSALDVTGSIDGSPLDPLQANFDATIEVQAETAAALMAQLGFEAGLLAQDPARIALTLNGIPTEALFVDGTVTGLESNSAVEGTIRFDSGGSHTLDLAIRTQTQDVAELLAGLDLASARVGTAPVSGQLSMEVTGRNPFALREIVLDVEDGARTSRLSGEGTFARGNEGRPHHIETELSGDTLSLPGVLALIYGSDRFSHDDEDGFSATPFAVVLPEHVELTTKLRSERLELAPGLTLSGATSSLSVRGDGLRLDNIEGGVFGGSARGSLALVSQSGMLSADGRLRIEGGRLGEIVWKRNGRPVASGAFDADLTFGGTGRSLSAIVASLGGEGAVSVTDGSLSGLSPVAFNRIVDAADRGAEIDAARAEELLAAYLDLGSLDFERADMTFSVAGGVARATRFAIDGDGLSSFVTGQINLNQMTVNSAWSVRAPPDPDAPDQVREFGIVFEGPLDDPQRSFDVSPLIGYLTIRAFEQEVTRLEELQLDIHDRGRIQRELDVLIKRRLETRQSVEQAEQDRQRREAVERRRRQREAEAARRAEEQRRSEEEARAREAAAAAEAAAQAAARDALSQRAPASPPSPPPPTTLNTSPPALNQPIEIAPPPGGNASFQPPPFPESGDPQLPQNSLALEPPLASVPQLQEPLPLGPPPITSSQTRRRPRTDPMAGFDR